LRKPDISRNESLFFRNLLSPSKASALLLSVGDVKRNILNHNTFIINTAEFSRLPGSPFAYWVESSTIRSLTKEHRLEGNAGKVRVGLQTGDDTRFLRLIWEVPQSK